MAEVEWDMNVTANEHGTSFGGGENIQSLDSDNGCTAL
jgi:hypothetical protein